MSAVNIAIALLTFFRVLIKKYMNKYGVSYRFFLHNNAIFAPRNLNRIRPFKKAILK